MRKTKRQCSIADVKVQMSSVYSRSKPAKRNFALIVNGVMFSTLLVAQLALGGGSAHAATPSLPTPVAAAQQKTAASSINQQALDEQAYVSTLNNAVAALKESGWSLQAVSDIIDSLSAIEKKMDSGTAFSTGLLQKALINTRIVVIAQGGDGLPTLRGQESTILSTVERISNRLDNKPASSGKGKVMIASVQARSPSVVIDNVPQSYAQPPVNVNGYIFVPLRGIFETLGAKVSWDNATETVTATKGTTTIKLTVGKSEAIVNGKVVQLSAPSRKVSGNTMVPLRFVAESLGGTARWDGATSTAYIESASGGIESSGTTQTTVTTGTVLPAKQVRVVGADTRNFEKRTVRYGSHDYGSLNDQQYQAVMKIVDNAVASLDQIDLSDEAYYLSEYMNGARWSGDKGDRSERNRGLYSAEQSFGELVADGVSKDEIIKIRKAIVLTGMLEKNTVDKGESPFSAYQALIELNYGCESISQVDSAVFDALGYNTLIYGPPGHVEPAIEVNGKWYTLVGLQKLPNFNQWRSTLPDVQIVVQPTYGDSIQLR